MNVRSQRVIVLASLIVLALALLVLQSRAFLLGPPAPPAVQGQSFSVDSGNPVTSSGILPADVLSQGALPLLACEELGLLCIDTGTGAVDNINGLSFGYDFVEAGLPPLLFSVATGSRGTVGSAVRTEADCSPAEPQADVFEMVLGEPNFQDLDGDGVGCGANNGFGLGLFEGIPSDDVDALDRDPCQYVDMNCDGLPENPIYITLAPGSPTLDLIGASAADILIASIEYVPLVWADGVTDLGLRTGDEIDALCVLDNGSGHFDNGDRVAFSLAPGSPSLATIPAGPADVLISGTRVDLYASFLGLESSDDVDALMCGADITLIKTYLPLVMKD